VSFLPKYAIFGQKGPIFRYLMKKSKKMRSQKAVKIVFDGYLPVKRFFCKNHSKKELHLVVLYFFENRDYTLCYPDSCHFLYLLLNPVLLVIFKNYFSLQF